MAFLRRWSLSLLFATILIPFAWWRNYFAHAAYQQVAAPLQIIGGLVVLASLLALWRYHIRTVPVAPAIFLLWVLLSTLWSLDPQNTGLAALGLAIYVPAFIFLMRSPYFTPSAITASWTVIVGLGLLALVLGPHGRTLGAVHPNVIGAYGLSVLVLRSLVARLTWPWIVFAFALPLYTESRTDLIALSVFVAFRFVSIRFQRRGQTGLFPITITALVTPVVLLLAGPVLDFVLKLSVYIGIEDPRRLTETLSGRTSFWQAGWSQFMESPILGHGFNTRERADLSLTETISAHSGVINMLLDIGIVGGVLFAVWYVLALLRAARGIRGWHPEASLSCCAALVGFIPRLAIEPGYLSLADTSLIVLLLCMAMPFAPKPLRRPTVATPEHSRNLPVRQPGIVASRQT